MTWTMGPQHGCGQEPPKANHGKWLGTSCGSVQGQTQRVLGPSRRAGARAALSWGIWARGSAGRQEGMVVQPLPCVHVEPVATQPGKSSGS